MQQNTYIPTLMSAYVRGLKHTRNSSLNQFLLLVTDGKKKRRHWKRMNISSADGVHFESLSIRLCTYTDVHVKTKNTYKSSMLVSQMVSRSVMLNLEQYGLFLNHVNIKQIMIFIYFVLIE